MSDFSVLAQLLETSPEEPVYFRNSTYEIVSKVAYLIGVPKNIFANQYEPPKMDVYDQLELNKNARIIRHLCIVRTAIERKFKHINDNMRWNNKSITSLPDFVPQESLIQLERDGISFIKKSSTKLVHHIVEINRIISDRINNCKSIFPIWLEWSYIRELFLMPDGLTEAGTKRAADIYYSNIGAFPYQMYINWTPSDHGNILYCDKKFVQWLYEWNNDSFTDDSKVSNVAEGVIDNIYDFIAAGEKVVIVVDCENSDPYKLSSMLRQLDEEYKSKISSIILFDDVHTSSAWNMLSEYTTVPVDRVLIERIKENKSLVDIKLTARTCHEHYKNNVDSFILASSDSDYWGLITSLPDAHFLALIESEKFSPAMKTALFNSGIFFCYIDDFYSGDEENLKLGAMLRGMREYMDNAVNLNVNEMFKAVLWDTHVEMTESEKKQFFEKYIKTIKLSIQEDGKVVIDIKK